MGNPRTADEIARAVNDDLIARLDTALAAIREEAIRAACKFKPFNSAHEGFAVLKEEVDELWDEVKGNNSLRASEEAVQVGAMAVRFLTDIPVTGARPMSVPPPLATSSDLLARVRDAVARFNALTPEQQRAHRQAQRKSWVIGEMLLEHPEMTRDEAETVYDRVVF